MKKFLIMTLMCLFTVSMFAQNKIIKDFNCISFRDVTMNNCRMYWSGHMEVIYDNDQKTAGLTIVIENKVKLKYNFINVYTSYDSEIPDLFGIFDNKTEQSLILYVEDSNSYTGKSNNLLLYDILKSPEIWNNIEVK